METEKDKEHTVIEGIKFTLFYDYDELRDHNLYKISSLGQAEWFEKRMEVVFLEPLRRVFDRTSKAHLELFSHKKEYNPVRTPIILIFASLLNGVESLGGFMTEASKNRKRFQVFILDMPEDWHDIEEQLWKQFRNAITHQFSVEKGGIEFDGPAKHWHTKYGDTEVLIVDPVAFFRDFENTARKLFNRIKTDEKAQGLFLRRFKEAYPRNP